MMMLETRPVSTDLIDGDIHTIWVGILELASQRLTFAFRQRLDESQSLT